MNDQLLESLLYRSEDPSVDFKAEQYVLSRLDPAKYPGCSPAELANRFEDKKSELLKDILAMSNAWRDGPAYILIGFKENKPHPPTLVGIEEADYGDDAAFQQFIAAKVNKALDFKYEVRPFGGKTVGIVTIPKQTRPFFSREQYGKVHKEVVYVRRGSSTMAAGPAEIAAMGADAVATQREARVDVVLESNAGEDLTTRQHTLRVVEFGDVAALPDYVERPTNAWDMSLIAMHPQANRNYWREFARWARARLRLLAVQFKLVNHSLFSLTDCKLEVDVAYADGEGAPPLEMERSLRVRPQRRHRVPFHTIADFIPSPRAMQRIEISGNPGSQHCVVWVDKMLAGETVKVDTDTLAVLPAKAGTLVFRMRLLAHEIPRPHSFEQTVTIAATVETMGMAELRTLDAKL